jgi:hypothetical protein
MARLEGVVAVPLHVSPMNNRPCFSARSRANLFNALSVFDFNPAKFESFF